MDKDNYAIEPTSKKFETWERNYCNLLGLGSAIDYALSWNIEVIWQRIQYLSRFFRERLKGIKGLSLCDLGKTQCGIVTFTLDNCEASKIQSKLFEQKIHVSTSVAEYARLDMDSRGLNSLVRASVHYYNTEEEIETFCQALESLNKPL